MGELTDAQYLDGMALRLVTVSAAIAAVWLGVPASAVPAEAEHRVLYQVLETDGAIAVDGSAHHNDGLLLGGVTRRDGAYQFHPLSAPGHRYDRIRIPFHPSLNPGNERFSYGARVKVGAKAEWPHREMGVLRHGDSNDRGGDYKLELKKTPRGHAVALCAVHHGGGGGGLYVQGRGTLETIADGLWHTVTCARRGDTVSLTVDGEVKRRRSADPLGSIAADVGLLIGCEFRKDGIRRKGQFVGLLDDIHVTIP